MGHFPFQFLFQGETSHMSLCHRPFPGLLLGPQEKHIRHGTYSLPCPLAITTLGCWIPWSHRLGTARSFISFPSPGLSLPNTELEWSSVVPKGQLTRKSKQSKNKWELGPNSITQPHGVLEEEALEGGQAPAQSSEPASFPHIP